MQAEIITIGDELLIGMTVDTNSAWIGQQLTNIGFNIYQITSISDKKEHILKAIDNAIQRSDLVLVTGGLGPTSDDITKETIAEYFDSELVMHNDTLSAIKNLLSARGLKMNDNNLKQAMVPDGCKVLTNRKGTAPGMMFNREGRYLVSMPGVPYEMKDIMENEVIPYIKHIFNRGVITYRLVMVYGTFEARLAEILVPFEEALPENISLAYLPTNGIIKLRLTGRGDSRQEVEGQLEEQIDKLRKMIPEYIYGYDGETMEECVGRLLREHKSTLAVAESCTGGTISQMLTSVPGCSEYLIGSIVAYNNRIKINELNVPGAIIESEGAVSREVVIAMADGIREKYDTAYAIATTGVAGPGGGTEAKPVGTVWIAVSSAHGTDARQLGFGNIRANNIRRSSLASLDMLRRAILKHS